MPIRRTLDLATPKSMGDVDLKRFSIDYIYVRDGFLEAYLSPSSAGIVKIYCGANPDAGPDDVVLLNGKADKALQFIAAIEDEIKDKKETA